MHVIYTNKTSGYAKGKNYRAARFFDGRPEQGITSVELDGDFPEIAKAYRDAGVEVVEQAAEKPKQKPKAKKAEPAAEQE